jgi:hypothetical protein
LAATGVALLWTGSARAEPGLDTTRTTVRQWIATQDLIFRESKAWNEERELLDARIVALEQEIGAAEAKLGESRRVLGELAAKRGESAAAEQRLESAAGRLAEQVTTLEVDVRRLHALLPPAVQEKVSQLHRRMPADPSATTVSVGERFQNVVGILNEMHSANGSISLVTEVRNLSDGKPSEVQTVYVGLGQAYYLSPRGEAGVGRPVGGAWEWRPANELATHVAELIEILQNKGKPRFIELPVTLE